MAFDFSEIREYFSRHVLGRVKIKQASLKIHRPLISSLRNNIETHPLRTKMQVNSPEILAMQGNLNCSSNGFRFAAELVSVKGDRIRRYVPQEIKVKNIKLIKNIKPENALRKIINFPQERTNRLKWQRKRPALSQGEMVLAYYGPIIEGAAAKFILNKQRGTLLVWYNPSSRKFGARGLFLCKKLGANSKPEWRWL